MTRTKSVTKVCPQLSAMLIQRGGTSATHHQYSHHGSKYFPSSTQDLPTEHGILLPPEAVSSQQIGEDGSTRTDAGQRDAKNEETQDRIMILGMLQSEKLGDEDTEEGQGEGGPQVSQIGTLQSFDTPSAMVGRRTASARQRRTEMVPTCRMGNGSDNMTCPEDLDDSWAS